MGFWYFEHGKSKKGSNFNTATLHKLQCNICPLNNQKDAHGKPLLLHPQMPPHGTKKPLVYFIGESPGEQEDKRGIPFVGKAGECLHFRIPSQWQQHIRWSNVVRTRPPENREPTDVEIECCRPSLSRDVEATKPKAIFAMGNIALYWALGRRGISDWTGRRVPIKVGNHTCWLFPMFHPSYVLRTRRWVPTTPDKYGSDEEFAFALHLRRAFDAIETLPEPFVHTKEMALEGIEYVTGYGDGDLTRVLSFLRSAARDKAVGFDYETNRIRPYHADAKILTVAIARQSTSLAFPLHHPQAGWRATELKTLQLVFKDFLHNGECRKVAHHLAFEQEWSAFFYGKECLRSSRWADTLSEAFILDEREWTHSLEFLCLQYFGINIKALHNLDKNHLDKCVLSDVLSYNAVDAKYHLLLHKQQTVRLLDEGLMNVYRDQLSRVPTAVLTQMQGVPVDQTAVAYFRDLYTKELDKTMQKIQAMKVAKQFAVRTGHPFRPASPHDCKIMLVDILKVDEFESADESHLSKIDHPLTRATIRWRKAAKQLSTYVRPLDITDKNNVIYPDGMLHHQLSTCSTETNRSSASDPNCQNFPKRRLKEVRKQITPASDQVMVSFDYGQIQARNIAMESLDKRLVNSMWERYDIHADWVGRIIAVDPSWCGGLKALKDKDAFKKARDSAKSGLVFASFFGAGAKTVAGHLGIAEGAAEALLEQFWDSFPGVRKWQKRLLEQYEKTGYVTGHSGFRRRAPIERNQIINSPIQSDEAIIVFDAMTRLSKLGIQAVMEIHDDLTFIWPKKDVDRLAETVVREMVNCPFEWARVVPIVVEMSIGANWAEMQQVETFASDTLTSGHQHEERKIDR